MVNEPLAILGAACYIPGASSPEVFWHNMLVKTVSIAQADEIRLNRQFFVSDKPGEIGKTNSTLAGSIDFDHFLTEVAPNFKKSLILNGVDEKNIPLDSGKLLCLYTVLKAIENANLNPFSLPSSDIAAFLGVVRSSNSMEYARSHRAIRTFCELLDSIPAFTSSRLTDSTSCYKAVESQFADSEREYQQVNPYFGDDYPHQTIRTIQTVLGLTSTGFTFDNACSSSLAGLYLAQNYFQNHSNGYALVGGMVHFSSSNALTIAKAQAGSATGSFPFEDQANGLVFGDGCSFVLVRPLQAALNDKNQILGIVRGVGISCDGKGKGLWAPMASGQQLAIQRAICNSQLANLNNLDAIEAHATGTKLGDATEIEALTAALKGIIPANKKIPITSVKGNIGHLLEAAGVTSLIKVLKSLQTETRNCQTLQGELSRKIDWESIPFEIPQQVKPWKADRTRPRQAIVDAFGIGGLNASVVVEGSETANQTAQQFRFDSPKSEDFAAAIVGVGCVLPDSPDTTSFNQKVENNQSALSEVPLNRANLLLDKSELNRLSNSRFKAGFVQNFQYDWKRHNIPPKQINNANPLQFMVLSAADQALADAGYPRNTREFSAPGAKPWDRSKTMVLVGTQTDSDFLSVFDSVAVLPRIAYAIENELIRSGYSKTESTQIIDQWKSEIYKKYPVLQDECGSTTISTLGSRIAKSYDITGGVYTLDSGDSSSFAVLDNAIGLLHGNQTDMIICAAGYSSMGHELKSLLKGDTPDSNVPAEGAVCFILKSVEKATQDGDKIYAIIDGLAGGKIPDSYNKNQKEEFISHVNGQTRIAELADSDICQLPAQYIQPVSKETVISQSDSIEKIFGNLRSVSGMAYLLKAIHQINRQSDKSGVALQICQADSDNMYYSLVAENIQAYNSRRLAAQAVYKQNINKMNTTNNYTQINSIEMKPILQKRNSEVPKIAYLFPGQGAQYPNMLANFCSMPQSEGIINEINRELKSVGLPDFKTVLQIEGDKLGKDVFRTQLSLLIADTFMYRLFESQGISPYILMGHSYGEYPAMAAAGVWPFSIAAKATEKRCQAIELVLGHSSQRRAKTTMLSTNASEDQIMEAMEKIPDSSTTLYISNRNAPTQTIISGTYESIKRMEALLLSCQRLALILPVPAAFHSPLVAGVCKPFGESLKPFSFNLPNKALLSSVTGNFEADPDIFRANLIEQMTKPVDFVAMIRKAYNNGCRYFVEVGPKKSLTNLAKQILSDCTDVSFFTPDNGKGGNVEQFLSICQELKNPILQPLQSAENKINTVPSPVSREISSPVIKAPGISFCRQSGTPYQMGFQYGEAYSQNIRSMVRRYTDIVGLASEKLLPPLPDMNPESLKKRFSEQGLEEMMGIADGAKVPLEAIVRHNICLFPTKDTNEQKLISNTSRKTDSSVEMKKVFVPVREKPLNSAISGCVQFAGTTPNGAFIQGCNIDLPFKRIVPDSIQVQLQTRQPKNGISHCYVGVTGMIGTIGGFNSKGLCVTSCTLLDYPSSSTYDSQLPEHSVLTQKILGTCEGINQALQIIYDSGANGGWTMTITENATGNIAQIEYCDKLVVHRDKIDFLVQANHSQLLHEKYPDSGISVPEHSIIREKRLRQLLTNEGSEESLAVDALSAFAALRDVKTPNGPEFPLPGSFRTINMVLRVDNVCSWMFNHTAQTFTVASTPDIYVFEDDKALWEEIPVRKLLPDFNPVVPSEIKVVIPEPEVIQFPVKQTEQKKPQASNQREWKEINKYTYKQYIDLIESFYKSAEKSVTDRYIECLVESPSIPQSDNSIAFKSLIIGSTNNPVAESIQQQLKSRGGDSVIFSLDNNGVGKTETEISEQIQNLWKSGTFYNVYIVPSWNIDDGFQFNHSDWTKLEETLIIPLYLTLREIYRIVSPAKEVGKLRFTAGTRMGGDGGFSGYSAHFEGGAIAGLMHNFRVENVATFKVNTSFKTVDFASKTQAETVASTLIDESLLTESQPDICYQANKRYYLSLIPEHAPQRNIVKSHENNQVWLITGGARGVTAELAFALASQKKVKLYIVGSSDLPHIQPQWRTLDENGLKELKKTIVRQALADKKTPAAEWSKVEKALEIDRNIQRLEKANIQWVYRTCDLSSYTQTVLMVKSILEAEGKIDGILHGAGFEKSGTFFKKEAKNVRRTAEVKSGGLWAILETVAHDVPKTIVMMGSVAGRLGGNGQTDYGMSNFLNAKMLNRFAQLHPDCKTCTVHWNAWGEVGMSVRPESMIAFKAIGMEMMPVREGCDHFLNEICSDHTQPEITPLPSKLYHDACLYDTLLDGCPAKNTEAKPESVVQAKVESPTGTVSEKPDSGSDAQQNWIYGNNSDSFALKRLLTQSGKTLQMPILFVCRDEALSKLMTPAAIRYRQQTVEAAALKQIQAWKQAGINQITVPAALEIDPVTKSFIEQIQKIISVKTIRIPWSVASAEVAALLLEDKIKVQQSETATVQIQEKSTEVSELSSTKTPETSANNPILAQPALLSNICSVGEEHIQIESIIDPKADTFLLQHQLKGHPILPLVMGLELFAESAQVLSQKMNIGHFTGFRNLRIIRGVSCTVDHPYRLVCQLDKSEPDSTWNGLIKGDFYNNAGKKINENCPYYRCQLLFNQQCESGIECDLSSMDKVINMTYPQLGERLIYHGPALQTLKTCHYNNDTEMIGDIVPDDNSRLILPTRTGQLSLYPAALDACLYACGMLYNVKGDRLIVVPDQFRLMEFGAGKLVAGKQCQCHVKRTKIIELPGGLTQVLFDFTLYNQDKQMVINVKDYCSTVVRNPQ